MSYGLGLAHEFPKSKVQGLGAMLPKEYGGEGDDLEAQGRSLELE